MKNASATHRNVYYFHKVNFLKNLKAQFQDITPQIKLTLPPVKKSSSIIVKYKLTEQFKAKIQEKRETDTCQIDLFYTK
jgi:hypothetical protein